MASNNTQAAPAAHRGWIVTFAGLGINLALGILYAWSMFKVAIKEDPAFGWPAEKLNDPYVLCCLVFAFAMILAGRCQDKIGPRMTATIGGVLVGLGFILASTSTSYTTWLLGFGVLVGLGMGFGYSSATPPALKWFASSKTGLIAGLVVAGFGLAPVYLAPLCEHLLDAHGVLKTMQILGIAFTIIVCGLSQLLVNPPAGYIPAQAGAAGSSTAAVATVNVEPSAIIRTPTFWLLWLLYFIGAGAGLMVIAGISGMAKKTMGTDAFIAVAVMAIGNAGGRVIAGLLSDKIGRKMTLMLVLAIQAALMFAAIPITASADGAKLTIVLLAAFIGFNYGANLSLFPSFAKELWGAKNFGMNYGILFTAWGIGSLLSSVSQRMVAATGNSYESSFRAAGLLLIVGAVLSLFIKTKRT